MEWFFREWSYKSFTYKTVNSSEAKSTGAYSSAFLPWSPYHHITPQTALFFHAKELTKIGL